MATTEDSTRSLPYPKLSELKFRNNEPMSYTYFNAHVVRMVENIRSLNRTATLQKATDTQWGVTRLATVDDIIGRGDKSVAFTNATMAEAMTKLGNENLLGFQTKGRLPMSKNYEWTHGEFIVGRDEHIAKRITLNPELVVYSHVSFIPLECEKQIMYTVRSVKTDQDSFRGYAKTHGRINFETACMPNEYREFHVYYHKSGYVICSNECMDPGQYQIRVCWDLLSRK